MSAGITAVVVSKGLDALLDVCLTHLRTALDQVVRHRDGAREGVSRGSHAIVVVDNASETPYDPARFRVQNAHWIRFDVDHSFAAACNAGFETYPNDRVLLLNNDVLLAPEALVEMSRVLDTDARAGICGTRLLFPDGRIQHCGVVFGAGKRGPYHLSRGLRGDRVPRGIAEYQAVTGACLLARASVWRDLDGLDESYPFGLEDIDFCLRARQQGWRVWCANQVDSLHFESMTPGRVELDVGSRQRFMERWAERYSLDG